MQKLTYALALALLASACGGDEDAPKKLTCEWFDQPDNCWRQVALAASSCLPAPDDAGTFSADRTSCSYEDGFAISFTEPVPRPLPEDGHDWNFTATRDGADCFAARSTGGESSSSQAITTHAGTAKIEATVSSVTVTCPDGSALRAGMMQLFECENGALFGMPGVGYASGGDDGTVTVIVNGAGDGSMPLFGSVRPLFTCEDAPATE
ncbi:hypothetical protein [Vulgatibacter sp.]|uniref:hypothetical protein n=1 Tax=Vulgatibacter sp. TaxID=1971226 RepID=UPI0035628A8A